MCSTTSPTPWEQSAARRRFSLKISLSIRVASLQIGDTTTLVLLRTLQRPNTPIMQQEERRPMSRASSDAYNPINMELGASLTSRLHWWVSPCNCWRTTSIFLSNFSRANAGTLFSARAGRWRAPTGSCSGSPCSNSPPRSASEARLAGSAWTKTNVMSFGQPLGM